jgi:hypothetical protein
MEKIKFSIQKCKINVNALILLAKRRGHVKKGTSKQRTSFPGPGASPATQLCTPAFNID